MLVGSKFIYVNIPRTGTSSFQVSCIKSGIDLKWVSKEQTDFNYKINREISIDQLNKRIPHIHEPLSKLKLKFGNTFPIVGVRRNRHEQFLSLWGHLLNIIKTEYSEEVYHRLSKLNSSEVLFFTPENLSSIDKLDRVIKEFFNKYDIDINLKRNNFTERYSTKVTILDLFRILFLPSSTWHNNDPQIKWFDFNNLKELEDWTSNTLETKFKLISINSSKHIENFLKLDSCFEFNYNKLYDTYDLYKNSKTLM